MPLSELVYELADTKFDSSSQQKSNNCSADLSSGPKNDFVELIWENGQIQLSRARKNQASNGVQSQTSKNIDKDADNGRTMGSVVDEASISVRSFEMGLNQDDEMAPWLNYSINDSLQQDYCQELFAELSGITVNENPQNKFALSDKTSNESQSARDLHTVSVHNDLSSEQGSVLQVSSARDDDGNRTRNTASYLNSSSSQQYQKSFPCFRSQVSTNNGDSTNNSSCLASSRDPKQVPPPRGCLSSMKVQRQLPVSSSTNSSLMNFSHFARPAAAKANFQNTGTRMGSEISSMERIGSKDRCVVANIRKSPEPMVINTLNGLVSSKVDAKPLDSGPADEAVLSKRAKVMNQEDDSRNDKNPGQSAESSVKGLADGERTTEPEVASSSVCSGNGVKRVSDEPTRNLKRRHPETEESEGPSEDVEEELQGAKKVVPGRGGNGTKRSRAAEVHNLSERRRRDRINEKMRALQELIPNCNKVDKASMLDEAIEYLKTLQLQVQIMSMGAGLCMPSMMLPPGMPQMHAAHMPPFSPMSVGMGMGFGMGMHDMIGGSNGCSVVQMPPMHVAHFPGPQISGPGALHGIRGSNSPAFGFSSQGLSMPYPCAPLVPISGGPPLKTLVGLSARKVADSMESLESAPGCSSKNSVQNVNLQMMQNSGASSSMNQTPTQCQGRNECPEQPVVVQNGIQASKVVEGRARQSADRNDNMPSGAAAVCE